MGVVGGCTAPQPVIRADSSTTRAIARQRVDMVPPPVNRNNSATNPCVQGGSERVTAVRGPILNVARNDPELPLSYTGIDCQYGQDWDPEGPRPTYPGQDRSTGPWPPGHDWLSYEQEDEMTRGSDALDRLSGRDSKEDKPMVLNAPPTLRHIYTRPVDAANLHPRDMAAWWIEGRGERTQPADSAELKPNSPSVRAVRPRWPRLRIPGTASSAAAAEGQTIAA
jgi:hypothetical protein